MSKRTLWAPSVVLPKDRFLRPASPGTFIIAGRVRSLHLVMTAPGAQHPGTFCSRNLWAYLFPKSCGYHVLLGVSTAAWRSRGFGCLGFCPGLAYVTLGSGECSGPAVTSPQGTAWGFVSCLCCRPAPGVSSFCPGVLTSSAAAGLWASSPTYTRCGSAAFPEPCVSRERSSPVSALCC